MVSKEYWANLSDEDKSNLIRRFCKLHGLGPDFDYSELKRFHEEMKERYANNTGLYRGNNPCENPVLVLKLVDPIMAEIIFSWMYTKLDLPDGTSSEIPFMGYHLVEYVFDKGSLMGFTDEEKNVLNHAINILKSRGV